MPGSGIHCVIKSKLGVSGSKIVRKHCDREAQKWEIHQLTITQDTEQPRRLDDWRLKLALTYPQKVTSSLALSILIGASP